MNKLGFVNHCRGYTQLKSYNLVRLDRQNLKKFLSELLSQTSESQKSVITKQSSLLRSFGFSDPAKFSYDLLPPEQREQLSNQLGGLNQTMRVQESKERLIRGIMTKTGLFLAEKEA